MLTDSYWFIGMDFDRDPSSEKGSKNNKRIETNEEHHKKEQNETQFYTTSMVSGVNQSAQNVISERRNTSKHSLQTGIQELSGQINYGRQDGGAYNQGLSKRPRLSSARFFAEDDQILQSELFRAETLNTSSNFVYAATRTQIPPSSWQAPFGLPQRNPFPLKPSSSNRKPPKKGSVISPDDRRPPTEEEIDFYRIQARILHNLNAYNMQFLAFFPQNEWLDAFTIALQAAPLAQPEEAIEVKQEVGSKDEMKNLIQTEKQVLRSPSTAPVFDEFLLEPENELQPLLNLTFSPFPDDTVPETLRPLRKRSSMRIVTRKQGTGTGGSTDPNPVIGPVMTVQELMMPHLPQSLVLEISNLTTFQKNLAKNKCLEVFAFFKLMLRNHNYSKLQSAQLLENSSRFVVRTILNWGREYHENGGRFNRSRIGKHKRVTLFSDMTFRNALLRFAAEKGESISVDTASQFIREYHAKITSQNPHMQDLPNPPSSRATVHRWLKLLNIKLGPRGKKKSAGSRSKKN